MKTAISIPDPIFKSAEKLASRLGLSRSDLYARALHKYLAEQRNDGVTEALNKVYSSDSSALDPRLQKLQTLSLPKKTW